MSPAGLMTLAGRFEFGDVNDELICVRRNRPQSSRQLKVDVTENGRHYSNEEN